MYVDGYVLCLKNKDEDNYTKVASSAGAIWMKHGALGYMECKGDDLTPDMGGEKIGQFPDLLKLQEDEMAIFAFVLYKSREDRDRINALVMEDPEMNNEEVCMKEIDFMMDRMLFGGFEPIVSYGFDQKN